MGTINNYKGEIVEEPSELEFNRALQLLKQKVSGKEISTSNVLQDIYRLWDDWTAPAISVFSCQNGCSACCYLFTQVTKLEAEYIKGGLAGLSKERKKAIRSWSHKTLALIEKISASVKRHSDLEDKYLRKQVPCIFLKSSKCTIYDFRPLNCRAHLVLNNPHACRTIGQPRFL